MKRNWLVGIDIGGLGGVLGSVVVCGPVAEGPERCLDILPALGRALHKVFIGALMIGLGWGNN